MRQTSRILALAAAAALACGGGFAARAIGRRGRRRRLGHRRSRHAARHGHGRQHRRSRHRRARPAAPAQAHSERHLAAASARNSSGSDVVRRHDRQLDGTGSTTTGSGTSRSTTGCIARLGAAARPARRPRAAARRAPARTGGSSTHGQRHDELGQHERLVDHGSSMTRAARAAAASGMSGSSTMLERHGDDRPAAPRRVARAPTATDRRGGFGPRAVRAAARLDARREHERDGGGHHAGRRPAEDSDGGG